MARNTQNILILLVLFFCSTNALAQNISTRHPNTLYVELLGSGGLYSLNYERLLTNKPKINHGFRIGGSFWNTKRPNVNSVLEYVAITGNNNHHADIGLGLNVGSGPNQDYSNYVRQSHLYFVPRLSYRYQKPQGGSMIRLGIIPFIPLNKQSPQRYYTYPLYFGIAIGQAF